MFSITLDTLRLTLRFKRFSKIQKLISPETVSPIASRLMKVDCWGRGLFSCCVCRITRLIKMIKFHPRCYGTTDESQLLNSTWLRAMTQLPRTSQHKAARAVSLALENFAQAFVGKRKRAILWRKFLVSVKEFGRCMLRAAVNSYLKYHMTWRCQTYQCINKRGNFKGSNVKRLFNFWSVTRIIADKCAKKRERQRMLLWCFEDLKWQFRKFPTKKSLRGMQIFYREIPSGNTEVTNTGNHGCREESQGIIIH